MAQWIKVLIMKHEGLSLISGTHMEEENKLLEIDL